MPNILIVEDEEAIRRVLKKVLTEDDNKNKIIEASDGVEAINKIKSENLELVICDIKMPKKDGIDVLNFLKTFDDKIPIIMISGHGDLKTAVMAMRKGAFDFIEKPPDLNSLLSSVRESLKNKVQLKKKSNKQSKRTKYDIVGESKKILELKQIIEKISPTNARVMILGPNGSGTVSYTHLTLPTIYSV